MTEPGLQADSLDCYRYAVESIANLSEGSVVVESGNDPASCFHGFASPYSHWEMAQFFGAIAHHVLCCFPASAGGKHLAFTDGDKGRPASLRVVSAELGALVRFPVRLFPGR